MNILEKLKVIASISEKEDIVIGLSDKDYLNAKKELNDLMANSVKGTLPSHNEDVPESFAIFVDGKHVLVLLNKDIMSYLGGIGV